MVIVESDVERKSIEVADQDIEWNFQGTLACRKSHFSSKSLLPNKTGQEFTDSLHMYYQNQP